jgi:hypothetical protein
MARQIIASTVFVAAILCTAFMAFAAQNFDFHAFYCAGSVARSGADPYLTQPLHACEVQQNDAFTERIGSATLPAPFPGYVIGAMEPLSRIPFTLAAKVWTALILIAMAVCVPLLMRLTSFGAPFIAAALCLSVGVTSLGFGEFVPFVLAALCFAALYAANQRWNLAAAGAAICLIEPHLGLPVCAALFLWRPQTRVALGITFVALAALSFTSLGFNNNVEYVTRVLPYHALSEIGSNRQFSLSVIVHALGFSNEWSLRVGLLSYIAIAITGIVLAQHAARHFGNDAFLVAVPAAAATIGGSFVHLTQIAAAIPLALLLYRKAPQYRTVLIAAIVLLAIPWLWIYQPLLILLAAIFAFYLAWEGTRYNTTAATLYAGAALVALLTLNAWSGGHAPRATAAAVSNVTIPAQYAEASWAAANSGYWSSGDAVSWAYRLPTWCGLVLVFACLSRRTALGAAA